MEFYDFTIVELDGGFVAIGRERGSVELKGGKIKLRIRTSRVFKLIDESYKQVHHHGSIEEPDLLKAYQEQMHSSYTKYPKGQHNRVKTRE